MSDHSITSLIEKLEGAEVGSRELDAMICDLLLEPIITGLTKKIQPRWPFFEGSGIAAKTPPVTTSLDGALALAERVLGEEAALDQLFAVLGTEKGGIKRIPLALCAALLRAQSEARV